MLRFIPDSWQEVLLRPLLLADSAAGLYSEIHAPDWRFAGLVLLLGIAAIASMFGRSRARLDGNQWRLLVGLTLSLYLWTLISGNGRYFLWGLLAVGPLVVVAARLVPATLAMRNTLLVGILVVQGAAVWMTFAPNAWGLRPWDEGPGLALEPHPIRERPGAFLTIGAISYSIVIPAMHPASRWANISGQQDLVPGMREHRQLQSLIDGPLPLHLMVRATHLVLDPQGQPLPQARKVMERALARQGLEMASEPCTTLQTRLAALPFELRETQATMRGFMFCPVRRSPGVAASEPATPVAPEMDEVFQQIEARCPRFFPQGSAHTRVRDGGLVRHYSHSDTSLIVDDGGEVYLKNFRALNPSLVGRTDAVRRGQFELDCDRLPGRYLPPWARH